METQRKPTAPGTPHRSSVEQLQGLWHTLARWHSTKPWMWSAGGNAGMLVVRDFRLEKPISTFDSYIIPWLLHSKNYQEGYFSIPPQGRSSTMGLWPPGTHKWGLGSIRTNECCWHFNLLQHPELPTSCQHQCTAMHRALPGNPPFGCQISAEKGLGFWGGFLGSPKFQTLGAPRSWNFAAPLEFQAANS